MKPVVRESLKNGIVFALVGAALALAAPPLLTLAVGAMGLAAGGLFGASTTGAVLGSALVFGGVGALSPGLLSLFGSIFGKDSPENTRQTATAGESDSRQIAVNAQQTPEPALQAGGQRASATFCQKLDADRTQAKAAGRLSL
jgi:hypothetical protein